MQIRPYKTDGATIYTPPCLIRWPSLFTPRVNKLNPQKAPQYEATFVLDGSEMCTVDGQQMPWLAAFKRSIDSFCIAQFGRTVPEMLQMLGEDTFVLLVKPNASPKRAKHAGIKERPQGVHFSAGTQYPLDSAAVVGHDGRTLCGGREAEIYDGIMGIGAISLYKWSHTSGKRGISANLIGLQKVGNGPRLGGANADFETESPLDAPGYDPSANFNPPPQEGAGAPPAGDYPQPAAAPAAQQAPAGAPPAGPANSGFGW